MIYLRKMVWMYMYLSQMYTHIHTQTHTYDGHIDKAHKELHELITDRQKSLQIDDECYWLNVLVEYFLFYFLIFFRFLILF